MSADLALALVVFAFGTSITPGPNNLMLLASGVNYGFRRTIPHMLSIGIGFMLMLLLVGLGLRRFLNSLRTLAVFNWTTAALLAASLWPLIAS